MVTYAVKKISLSTVVADIREFRFGAGSSRDNIPIVDRQTIRNISPFETRTATSCLDGALAKSEK